MSPAATGRTGRKIAVSESRFALDRSEPPRSLGRVLSSRQFWDLMQRWKVPDDVALELIAFPGKLGASGKRPRFRFTTRQQRMTSYLLAIDNALTDSSTQPAWLHRAIGSAPFGGRSPIDHMIANQLGGMADAVQALNRIALRRSLDGGSRVVMPLASPSGKAARTH